MTETQPTTEETAEKRSESDLEPVTPLFDGAVVVDDTDDGVAVSTDKLDDGDFAVPRPAVGDTHMESVAVLLEDARLVVFSDPKGCIDESRVFPDVVAFGERTVYDLSDSGGDD